MHHCFYGRFSMLELNKRLQYFDLAKGFGIILIILGHHSLPDYINNWIYSFHVPLFFIISGFFYKKKPLLTEIKNGFRRLIFPTVVTSIICIFCLSLVFTKSGSWQGPDIVVWLRETFLCRGSYVIPGLWFIFSLFYGRILLCLIYSQKKYLLVLTTFFSFLISVYLFSKIGEIIPFYLLHGLLSPIFIVSGSLIKQFGILDRFLFSKYSVTLLLLALVSGIFLPINMFKFVFPLNIINIVTAVVLSVIIILMFKYISEKVSNNKVFCFFIKSLSFCGRFSLLVLCTHAWIHTLQISRLIDNLFFMYTGGIVELIIVGAMVFGLYNINVVKKIFSY